MNASINAMRDRNERATREATTIIEAEQKARAEKTERLRALRLGQEAARYEEEPMAKQSRKVFHSSMTKNGWVVTEGGETVSRNNNQKANEAAAISAARKVRKDGGLSQAVLHKSDGSIREERTYGKDPERTPG